MNKEEKLVSKCCNKPVTISNGKYFCSGVYGCGNWCDVYDYNTKTLLSRIEDIADNYFEYPFSHKKNDRLISKDEAVAFAKKVFEVLTNCNDYL